MATRSDSPETRTDAGWQDNAAAINREAEIRDRERELATTREGQRDSTLARRDRGELEQPIVQTPFALMQRLMEDMDQIVREFWYGQSAGRDFGPGGSTLAPMWTRTARDFWNKPAELGTGLWSPRIEAFERDDHLIVRAELPGVSKDDVKIDITDTVLTIQGERRHEATDQDKGVYRSERSYGRFYRIIPLPEGVDPDKADAKFNDGVLEISVPAPERQQRKGRRLQL